MTVLDAAFEMSDVLELEITDLQAGDALRLTFSVTNRADRDAFVRDLVVNAALDALPGEAYTSFDVATKTLHLLLGTPPMPDRRDVALFAPAVPLARRLSVGERSTGSVEIAIPVEEWQPYGAHTATPPFDLDEPEAAGAARAESRSQPRNSDEALTVRLTVEFVLEGDIEAYSRREDYPEGYYRIVGHPIGRVSRDRSVAEPIPVVISGPDFPRF